MTNIRSVSSATDSASGGAATSDAEADLKRLEAETRRLNAEADLLMAMDRKRFAEKMLHGRGRVPTEFLTGALFAGLIGLTVAVLLL